MCGIVGTLYKKNFALGKEIKKEELKEVLVSIESGREKAEYLLEIL